MSERFRKPSVYIACVVFLIFQSLPPSARGQKDKETTTAAKQTVQGLNPKGFPLTSSSTDVTGNISVEATLIPAKVASTVFGREVAHNYAIISLTISNRSSDDSFIVHTIFVDYSHWLLSGSSKQSNYLLCPDSAASGSQAKNASAATGVKSGGVDDSGGKSSPCCPESSLPCGNTLKTWQQQTLPNQISTVETRIVRGELLDRQPWTTRNWVLRALQAVGSIAAGFTFATTNQDWIKGIGAYNAHGIPAGQTFWPDATVGQMNRISDFGFQVNKVIGKQSSDIVVAFFPIDRFLTPGLRKIFLDSPSVFFSPYGMLLDPKRPALIDQILEPIFKRDANNLTQDPGADGRKLFLGLLPRIAGQECDGLPAGCKGTKCPNPNGPPPASPDPNLVWACQVANLLDQTSLNTVRVIVGGTMTVDVDKIPPQITGIEVDVPAGKDESSMWVKGATITGIIRGSFLGGGTPAITNPENIQVAGVAKDSTDKELHFSITLKEELKPETALTFEVSKKSDGATIKSAPYVYTIPKATSGAANTGAGATNQAKPEGAATPPPAEQPKPAVAPTKK